MNYSGKPNCLIAAGVHSDADKMILIEIIFEANNGNDTG